MAYVITNPVASGLVGRWSHWPGARSPVNACTTAPTKARRPGRLLRPIDEVNPPVVLLEATPPPQLAHLTAGAFVAALDAAVNEREERLVADHLEKGGRFLGAARARSASPDSRPAKSEPRRQLAPAIAAKGTRLRLALIAALINFRRAYAAARATWLDEGSAVFPPGTFQIRKLPGVVIAGPAPT